MQVQGAGATSPLVGQTVRVEGVVTGDYQAGGQVGGFYLQDPAGDGDAATSDGVLVFDSADPVQPGDRVRVTGRVVEFERSANAGDGTVTELASPFSAVTVCGTGAVAPTTVDLPFAPAGPGGPPVPERYEGMRVSMPNARTVTEVFTLGRFGEVVLTSGAALFSPTNGNVPGAPEAIDVANDANRILLDDALSGPNLFPGAYDVGDDPTALPRIGDQVAPEDVVTGVFTFDFGVYRVQPVGDYVDFVTGTPRPAAPDQVGGDVTVASFNVLNYFTTLNDAGWAGEQNTPRGATSPEEFSRQQTKIVQGIVGLDADIVGLIEIENNGPTDDPRVGPDAVAAARGRGQRRPARRRRALRGDRRSRRHGPQLPRGHVRHRRHQGGDHLPAVGGHAAGGPGVRPRARSTRRTRRSRASRCSTGRRWPRRSPAPTAPACRSR